MLTKTFNKVGVLCVFCFVLIHSIGQFVKCEETTVVPSVDAAPKTTESPKDCSLRSSSCDYCVEDSACYYCYVTKKCAKYPFNVLKPMPNECSDSMSDISWRTCKVSANVLVIIFGTLFGLVALIIILLFVWCCCVKKCVRSYNEKQSVKWDRKRVEMVNRQEERTREREQMRDEIRAKYGLGSGPNYKKF